MRYQKQDRIFLTALVFGAVSFACALLALDTGSGVALAASIVCAGVMVGSVVMQ